MAISAVSSSSTSQQTTQTDDGWQQFTTMADAIQSGDLDSAQQEFAGFAQSQAGQVAAANPQSPLAQALDQIGQALQSGDTDSAQKALASLRPHHHHHHKAGGAQHTTSAAPASPPPSDPSSPGANVNLTA